MTKEHELFSNAEIIMETNLPFLSFKKGKVRDLYDLGEKLIIVSTDRISAFDQVLPNGIPFKGEALNRISSYWFRETKSIISNHLIDIIDPRTILVKKTKPIKIEFVVRGYLYGSAWEKYETSGEILDFKFNKRMSKAEKLEEPILTPTTKSDEGHDVELARKDVLNIIGKDRLQEIEETCLRIYEYASYQAEKKGMIIADTKLEFGIIDGEIILIDELLTPDSSRFWSADSYNIGKNQISYDKQYVRDYLLSIKWTKKPPVPKLPLEVVLETARKYIAAYETLTSRKFGDTI